MGGGTPHRGSLIALAVRMLVLGVIVAVASATLSPVAAAAPTCIGSAAAGLTYTCVPNGSGSVQVTVPARVTSISVVADGGGGGKNDSLGNGGSGARVSATIAVTPGTTIAIHVGAGGRAGLGSYGNVGGTVVVVAGGGGGGGSFYGGSASAAAGLSGGNGGGTCAVGGGGGNAAGSGSAGTTGGTGLTTASTAGYAGRGGDGTYGAGGASSGGGGGGGGYGGGGAGNWNGPYMCATSGGGGAGGSYGPAGAVFGSAGNAGGIATTGAGGDGEVSITFLAPAPTIPNAPTDLIFSDISQTTMTAYWSAPADDGGSAIIGYDVTVTPGATTRVMSPEIALTGLSPSTTHSLSITAVNAVGASATALTGSQATTTPGTPPGPATNLVFSGVTSSSITASWTAPTPVSGWPTLGYQVRVDGGTLTWAPTASFTASGLDPGTLHTFAIMVVNGAGSSPELTGSQWTLATLPDAPTSLVFGSATSTTIAASWTAPTNTGGSPILKYTVSVAGGPAVDVVGTSYTATGLTSSAWHTFSILAVNAIGASASELWSAATTSAPPGSPAMTATATTVGSPSTITLAGFTAFSTQTVQVTAPDNSMASFTVTVDASGTGTGSYTPTQAGVHTVISAPTATSTAFAATAPPTPAPSDDAAPGPAAASAVGTPAGATALRARTSIRITGRAGRGRRTGRIYVTGTTTGLTGQRVVAHVRLAGSPSYVTRGTLLVDARGRFAWQWQAGRSASVYFTSADGSRSNRIAIDLRRR